MSTYVKLTTIAAYAHARSWTWADEPLAGSFAEAASIFSGNEISAQFCGMWLPISVGYFQGTSSVKSTCLRRFNLEPEHGLLCSVPATAFSWSWLLSILFLFCTVSSMQGSSGCYPWSEAEHVYPSLSGASSRARFDAVLKHWNRGGECLSYSINMLINGMLISSWESESGIKQVSAQS